MRRDSLFKRQELFVCSAIIAAHASNPGEGFRQRDVRFYIELFSNWICHVLNDVALKLSNTQVLRYLEELIAEGYARQRKRKGHPRYVLTRVGLIEILKRLTLEPPQTQPEQFFFLHSFIENYRSRLELLIEEEGSKFPLALKLEVESLLDTESLVERQIEHVERELQQLEARIRDSSRTSKLSKKLYAEGEAHEEVMNAVEKKYPYELNSQKPLTELLSGLTEEHARWELEIGSIKRAEQIWLPSRALLLSYLQSLKRLKP